MLWKLGPKKTKYQVFQKKTEPELFALDPLKTVRKRWILHHFKIWSLTLLVSNYEIKILFLSVQNNEMKKRSKFGFFGELGFLTLWKLSVSSLFVMLMLLFFVSCCSVNFLIVLKSCSKTRFNKIIKIINSKCKFSWRQTALEIVIFACFGPIVFQPLQLQKSNKIYEPCNGFSKNIVVDNVWV